MPKLTNSEIVYVNKGGKLAEFKCEGDRMMIELIISIGKYIHRFLFYITKELNSGEICILEENLTAPEPLIDPPYMIVSNEYQIWTSKINSKISIGDIKLSIDNDGLVDKTANIRIVVEHYNRFINIYSIGANIKNEDINKLPLGNYTCELIIKDNDNNEYKIKSDGIYFYSRGELSIYLITDHDNFQIPEINQSETLTLYDVNILTTEKVKNKSNILNCSYEVKYF